MTSQSVNQKAASRSLHMYFLVALRIFIGWHLLYEGIIKLLDPAWTSASYLSGSSWIFSGMFHWMADNPGVLQVVDFLNTWGLILAGFGLFFGLFTNLAIIAGIVMLGLYYIAHPPFISQQGGLVRDGHFLIIDRNLIELTALSVLRFFNTGRFLGLDIFIYRLSGKRVKAESPAGDVLVPAMKRREILKQLATIPLFGALVYATYRKERLKSIMVKHRIAQSEASAMPYGKIGDLNISRMILGSNWLGTHARDLLFAKKLGGAYNTKERLFYTYELAESGGINTIIQGRPELLREYKTKRGGNLKTIYQVHITKDHDKENIRKILTKQLDDSDVIRANYIQGDRGDYLSMYNRMDLVGTAMEVAKELGITLGLGGHSIQVPKQCLELGIMPDFFVKTFHHDNYWSATPKENRVDYCWYDGKGGGPRSGKKADHNLFHDNIWCLDAEETANVMEKIKVPWIAFKVLAAGAISPSSGFKFAFENGADFIAVGMADFEIEEDMKILQSLFERGIKRDRPWYSGMP